MLGWKAVEGEEFILVINQALNGFGILCLECVRELFQSNRRFTPPFRHPNFMQHLFAFVL
jgi:hypothetical protein